MPDKKKVFGIALFIIAILVLVYVYFQFFGMINAEAISLCNDGSVYSVYKNKLYLNGKLINTARPVLSVAGVNVNDFYWIATDQTIYHNSALIDGAAVQISTANNAIWVVNKDNGIFRTPTSSIQWFGINGALVNVCAIDINQAVGVNAQGDIYKTTDGGNSWTMLGSGAAIASNGTNTITVSKTGVLTKDGKVIAGTYKAVSISKTKWAAIDVNNRATINSI